jgi:hypothetical protein
MHPAIICVSGAPEMHGFEDDVESFYLLLDIES